MLRKVFLTTIALAILATGCGGGTQSEEPAPAISTSAADNLLPGQVARSAALQVEIRSAGHECSKVIRSFNQGTHDGSAIWNAECEGGETYGVASNDDGTTDVFDCETLEDRTGTACFEKFED